MLFQKNYTGDTAMMEGERLHLFVLFGLSLGKIYIILMYTEYEIVLSTFLHEYVSADPFYMDMYLLTLST